MNMRMVLFFQLITSIVLAHLATQALGVEPEDVFRIVPRSTVAAVVTANAERSLASVEGTAIAKVLSGPAFQPFLSNAQKIDPVFNPTSLSPLPWQSTADLLGSGAFAVIIMEVENQLPEFAMILEMRGNRDAWNTFIEKHLTSVAKAVQKAEPRLTEGQIEGQPVWNLNAVGGAFKNQIFCMLGDWLLVCESEAGLRLFVESSKSPDTKGLTADPRYTQTFGKLDRGLLSSESIWIFADPLRVDFLRARAAGWPETEISKTFGTRHGFDALRSLGGCADFNQQAFDVRYRFHVWVDQPVRNGMKLLDFQPRKTDSPATWIPSQHVSSYATLGWNLQSILDFAGPLVNEMIEDVTGKSDQTFERFLAQIAADDGPGIDLQKEFMPLLGERVQYLSMFLPPASTIAEQTILAIEIKEHADEAEVADLVEILVDSTSTLRIDVPGFSYPLWKLGSGQRAGGTGPAFSTPGVMVAHGCVIIASNFNSLRQFVAVPKPAGLLAEQMRFKQMELFLNDFAGTNPAVRVVAFPAEDFENTYELLRTGRVEQAESVYTMLLNPILKNSKTPLPFEKLPPFNTLKNSLGPAGIQLNVVDNGWEVHGANLRANE